MCLRGETARRRGTGLRRVTSTIGQRLDSAAAPRAPGDGLCRIGHVDDCATPRTPPDDGRLPRISFLATETPRHRRTNPFTLADADQAPGDPDEMVIALRRSPSSVTWSASDQAVLAGAIGPRMTVWMVSDRREERRMATRRKRVPGDTGPPPNNLCRATTWAGVRSGDAVEVSGTRLRSAKWEFVAHVRNVVTGDEWIDVVGGGSGDRKLRSFPPDRVFAPGAKQRRRGPRPSLADVPQLPLG